MADDTPPRSTSSNADPLHGITLERMLVEMSGSVGWEYMGRRVRIACFTSDPSVSSSLKFLRRTPWAREKVERMYVDLKRRGRLSRPAESAMPAVEGTDEAGATEPDETG